MNASPRSLCVLFAGTLIALAQAQNFSRRYDPWDQQRPETGFGIELADSGFMVFAGAQFADSLIYSSVVSTVYIALDGHPLDTNRVQYPLHATYPGWADVAVPLPNGGYAVGGGSYEQDGTQRPLLYRFHPNGELDTLFEYGISGQEWIGRQVRRTPDGGFVLCGETSSSGIVDAFLIKTDSAGNEELTQTYGGATTWDFFISVDLAPGGGYYLGGKTGPTPSNFDQWVVLVDSAGNTIWDNTYGTPFNDYPNAHITTAANGDCLIASHTANNNFGYGSLSLARIDPSGGLIWSTSYDGVDFAPVFFAVKEIPYDGNLIAAGQTHLPGYMQGAIVCTTAAGDSIWLRYYHYYDSLWTEGEGGFRDVIPTIDGGCIAVGTAYGSNNSADTLIQYSQDIWVVKVDSLGCLVPGCDGISTITTQITNYRDALRVAPNPASTSAQLRWQLPQALTSKGAAVLTIVDAQSRVVRTEALGLPSGTHELDVSALAPGLYHLHVVQAGTWITGCKLVVE